MEISSRTEIWVYIRLCIAMFLSTNKKERTGLNTEDAMYSLLPGMLDFSFTFILPCL